ncbi:MAG: hypothetical protein K6T59_16130 [Bryobacteraceae bacterium]|nr:hypothetical protein [Bryobacteraceae bacterium]
MAEPVELPPQQRAQLVAVVCLEEIRQNNNPERFVHHCGADPHTRGRCRFKQRGSRLPGGNTD